jgi:nitronate monooxygenase
MWPDRRLIDLVKTDLPIVQAPMAGAMDAELVIAASQGGALGSLPCAALSVEKIREQVSTIGARAAGPINLNFFCHPALEDEPSRQAHWLERLSPYYASLGLDPRAATPAPGRTPFDAAMLDLVLELKPAVVSFHFGLPDAAMMGRLKAAGIVVMSSATTVAEAVWLERHGVDAVIAQGAEAGGHRGSFLAGSVATQPGTFALVPQVVDAVRVPVIAAGGVSDGRGIAAAFALGAAGVQIGTAYLRCPEAKISAPFRAALGAASDDSTAITNVMSGRPARGIYNKIMRELGPMSADAPAFPHAAKALAPLRAAAEARGSSDFSALWAGQSVALTQPMPAADLTRSLAAAARKRLDELSRL